MRFKAIDLFCGAGGLSIGLKKSGFRICLGVDIDESALKTYKYNLKRTKVLKEDIKKVTGEKITKLTGIKKGDNFLLAGCPPCQGFSSLGKRDVNDEKNGLVYEYIRIINELEPTFILMENVPGMFTGVGKEIFKKVIENQKKVMIKWQICGLKFEKIILRNSSRCISNIGLDERKLKFYQFRHILKKKGRVKKSLFEKAIFDCQF